VTLDDLDLEIHFVKEGVVLSKDSRSGEKFIHGIKVLMAKNYVDNLGEEARKGMLEKAEQGMWPSVAPAGYLNVQGTDGKRSIVPDPAMAPFIVKVFEWYATGRYSMKEIAKLARDGGFKLRNGKPVRTAVVH
jgi:site-specific DNA recombinase